MNQRAPLTPANCFLGGFDYMPLDVDRLRKSRAWLIAKRRPELAFYMVNLWTASWKETPAASLEDDDDVLADAAMCPPDRWAELKEDVLRGFVLCDDGRLYHEVIAVKALEAWLEKLGMRISSGYGNAKKHGATFDDSHLRDQIQIARDLLFTIHPDSKYFTKRAGAGTAPAKKPPKARVPKVAKAAPKADVADSIPLGSTAGADQGPDGLAIHPTSLLSTPPSVGGKPPTTPSADAPADGGLGIGEKPATTKAGAKALLKPSFTLLLPEWVPGDDWAKFVDMRMRMGKAIPFTEAAALGIVRKLEKLRDEGQDVAAMLDASTRNGWRDVFAVKGPLQSRTTATVARHAGASHVVFGASRAAGDFNV